MTMVGELFAFSFWLFAPHKVMLNLFQHLTESHYKPFIASL